MTKGRHSGLGNPLINANQIVTEAQKRWLHTDEICGILHNYKNFPLATKPANMPPSGSFFLFNRKELRCFRKDGYNWTKKKRDGKTVMEGHEKLKVGGIGVLNCYYAHREENKKFQRRSYWLLQGEASHVVLVHYLEVKGKRKNFNRSKETEEAVPYSQETEPNSEMDFSVSSCFLQNNYQVTSQSTDTTGLNSAQALEHVNTESAGNHQTSSGFHPFFQLQQPMVEKFNAGLTDPSFPGPISGADFASLTEADKAKDSNDAGLEILNFPSWEDDLGNGTSGNQAVTLQPSFPETQPDTNGVLPEQEDRILGDLFYSNFDETLEFGNHPQIQNECQGKRTNFNCIKETEEAVPYSQETEPNSLMDSCVLSCFLPNNYQVTSQSTDTAGLNSAHALEHVDTESGVDFASLTEADKAKHSNNAGLEILDFSSWADDLGNATSGNQAVTSQPPFPETQPDTNGVLPEQEDPILWDLFNSNFEETLEFGNLPQIQNECQGNMTNFNLIKETEEAVPYSQENEPNFEMDSSVLSCFLPNNYQVTSQSTDTTDLNSAKALEHVNTESASKFWIPSFLQITTARGGEVYAGLTDTSFPGPISDDYQGNFSTISGVDFASLTEADKAKDSNNAELEILDFSSWKDDLGNGTSGNQAVTSQPSLPETQPDTNGVLPEQEDPILGDLFNSNFDETLEFWNLPQILNHCQTSEGEWPLDQNVHAESVNGVTSSFHEQDVNSVKLLNSREPFLPKTDKQDNDPMQSNLQVQLSDADHGYYLKSNPEINMALEGKTNSSFNMKKTRLDGSLMEGNLKKLDSFNQWMSKELGGVNESHTQSSSEVYWDTVESENRADESNISPQVHLDNYTFGPSLCQDQLFSIIDFSPNWAYEGTEVKVLITGRFLKSQQEIENCKWSCMFGEVEVPAEVIADDVIRCHTPVHKAARVPFYVTCSNRLACSEVREFEYRVSLIKDVDIIDYSGNIYDDLLMRFKNFLSLTSAGPLSTDSVVGSEKSQVSSKISSLLEGDNDEWDQMLKLASEKDFSPEKVQDMLLEKLLKEKLHVWLLQKSAEDGKGPSVVDEGGQGVLHFAAALGYDWALEPTIIAGVSVNFRDVNGWTALHWAVCCGRERTVCSLVSLGAAPGALTDPSPKYPSGRTAADLASAKGHKGIAGYLAESHLSTHLSSLTLDTGEGNAAEISGAKAVQKVSEQRATPVSGGNLPYGLSLKDSLAAVCNASQAFARICQAFRVESCNKKQLKEYGDDTYGMSDEQALSLLALKTNKSGQHDLPVHAAAIRIQNKFRSWKGRREFLIIRQQIVKIQAHVRGHQVRKNYKKFTWSVGIVEKLILRWRRKGSGLRGFKSEALTEGHRMQDKSSEDDYDFLKEGRKQTEQRLQKALARVKSMAQYPDARDQYRRLLNVVTDIQGSKVVGDGVPSSSEETADYNDEMIDFEAFLEDDTYMPSA